MNVFDSAIPDLYDIPTRAPGPSGSLPFTPEILREWPSGHLFGWTQDAGMGWKVEGMDAKEDLVLSWWVETGPGLGIAIPAESSLTTREDLSEYLENVSSEGVSKPLPQEFLPPLEEQEVWAPGVTYYRSRAARMVESAGGGDFYDRVYVAERPELFFKTTAHRVVGSGAAVRISAAIRSGTSQSRN